MKQSTIIIYTVNSISETMSSLFSCILRPVRDSQLALFEKVHSLNAQFGMVPATGCGLEDNVPNTRRFICRLDCGVLTLEVS